jgi:hypothetical protein
LAIRDAACSPLITGMLSSRITMSGSNDEAARTASAPLAASPQTSHPGRDLAIRFLIAQRMNSLSSTISILGVVFTALALDLDLDFGFGGILYTESRDEGS